MGDLAIYTVIMGDGYALPRVSDDGADYICFTDQPDIDGAGWQVRLVEPMLLTDLPRSSRVQKLLPHLALPDHERSIYIDPSVELLADAEAAWQFMMRGPGRPAIGLMHHTFRETLDEEISAVIADRLDRPAVVRELREEIRALDEPLLHARPRWGGFIARRHHDPACIAFGERWFSLVLRYSRRDQLTLPVALQKVPRELIALQEVDDIYETAIHRWPSPGYVRPPRYYVDWDEPQAQVPAEAGPPDDAPPAAVAPDVAGSGYDPEADLHFVLDDRDRKVYVAHQKRLELYANGVAARIDHLLGDYRIARDLVSNGDLVVDVGAHSGELGLWAHDLGARYIAFEPDPAACSALVRNVADADVHRVALSDAEGEQRFYLATQDADSSLFTPAAYSGEVTVRTRRLDDVLREAGETGPIKLMKIEAEGMEPEVLRGAAETLRRVEWLAVDAGPERGGEPTAAEVLAMLTPSFEVVDCFLLRGTFLLRRRAWATRARRRLVPPDGWAGWRRRGRHAWRRGEALARRGRGRARRAGLGGRVGSG